MGFVGKNATISIDYCKSKRHRYFLRIVINQTPGNRVLVIMKNPSATCINQADGHHAINTWTERSKCRIDRTTGKVLRKIKGLGVYNEIIILNLYSLYDANPHNVNRYYYGGRRINRQIIKNNQCLRRIISNYTGDIICAWGKSNGINKEKYDKQIDFVKSLVNSASVLMEYDPLLCGFVPLGNTSNHYPLHGLNWK